jgi:hypothetical protein
MSEGFKLLPLACAEQERKSALLRFQNHDIENREKNPLPPTGNPQAGQLNFTVT